MGICLGKPPVTSAGPGQNALNYARKNFSSGDFIRGVFVGAVANSLALIMIVASNSFFTVVSPARDDRVLTSAEQMADKVKVLRSAYVEKSCQKIVLDVENWLVPGMIKSQNYDEFQEVEAISLCLQRHGYDASYHKFWGPRPDQVSVDLSAILGN